MKLLKKESKVKLKEQKKNHPTISCDIDSELLNKALKVLLEEKLKKLGILKEDNFIKVKSGKKQSCNLVLEHLNLNDMSLRNKIKALSDYLKINLTESSMIVFEEKLERSKRNYKKALTSALVNDCLENLMINYIKKIKDNKTE